MNTEKNIREKITDHLKSIKRSRRWLAHEIDVDYDSFYYTLTHFDSKFTKERISKINEVLNTNFTD